MDARIKISSVEYILTVINACLNVTLAITDNDVKVTLTSLYTTSEIKYFTQRMISTTISIISTSTSGRGVRMFENQ